MRLPAPAIARPPAGGELPLWPPLLATRGPGARSAPHAHHGMHLLLCLAGELGVRAGSSRWERAPGVLTAPDVRHGIDAQGTEILLVFLDPESDAGCSLRSALRGPVRLLSGRERELLLRGADPADIMRAGGEAWTRSALEALGCEPIAPRRPLHPAVRKLLRLLAAMPPHADTSLEALAAIAGLSPGRLMHVFTESIGVPIRPYLAWLRLQRAGGAIASGLALSEAAHAAGFADGAHMTRTFRRMLGMPPSALRQALVSGGARPGPLRPVRPGRPRRASSARSRRSARSAGR